MWIKMKTYEFEKNEDICKILEFNKIKKLHDTFEIVMKDVNKVSRKQATGSLGLDFVVIDTHVVSITQQKPNSPVILFRKNRKLCHVCFVNVKNENEEHFSSLVEDLDKNDRILVINGVSCKNNIKLSSTRFTIAVRPENHSLVFLFKFKTSYSGISVNVPITVRNLSQIIHPGVYSLFGCVTNIVNHPNEDCMVLRLLCSDRSCIKTLKYSNTGNTLKSNSKKENDFDSFSNQVDVLVKNPCTTFTSLVPNQRVCLNNVKVKNLNESNIFSLKVMGLNSNLMADPIETASVQSLRPPKKLFPIPNELKPVVKCAKTRLVKTSSIKDLLLVGNQSIRIIDSSTDEDEVHLSPIKKLQTLNTSIVISDSSSDEDVQILPKQKLTALQSKQKVGSDCYVNTEPSTSFCRKRKMSNYVKKNMNLKPQINIPDKKCNKSKPISIETCTEKSSSSEMSSSDSCSPPFFQKSTDTAQTVPSCQPLSSKQLQTQNPTECLGPCRLVLTDPNVYSTDEIVSGYCAKNCFSFFPKSVLTKSSNMSNYICPKCSNIVHLSFFFKMNFLYGKNESRAVEVCCYGVNALRVLKKLTKKSINPENYLSNSGDRKLIIDTIKMFIDKKTKANIVISDSPIDKLKLLLSIDTKYVVTSFD